MYPDNNPFSEVEKKEEGREREIGKNEKQI
jgi:hypothetical protein